MENQPNTELDESQFMTVKQDAKYFNVSPGCVYRLCITNKLTHYKFGERRGALRIGRDDMLAFVRSCQVVKREADVGSREERRKPWKQTEYAYKRLDLRPKHACGATTMAGCPARE